MFKNTLILAFLFSMAIQAQNICTEVLTRYNYSTDLLEYDTVSANITNIRTNAWMNASAAIFLNKFKDDPMQINITNNQRVTWAIFSLPAYCNWGNNAVSELFKGDYEESGLTEDQINYFDIYMDGELSRNRLLLHTRHELEARTSTQMDNLIDSICIGIRIKDNQIIAGKLVSYNETNGIAFLLLKNGYSAWYAKLYSISKYRDGDKNYY